MKCPICKAPVPDDGPQRPNAYPFCSDRCKLIDLGRWLGEAYRLPKETHEEVQPSIDTLNESP